MSKVNIKRRDGQQGLASTEVAATCGLHKNWISTVAVLDLDGGGATTNLLVPAGPGRIQRVRATYSEANSTDTDGTIVCGSLLYSSGTLVTDADKFATATPTPSAAIGSIQDVTLTSTVDFEAGEVITVAYTTKTGNGQCYVTVEYTIDDEPTP